LGLSLVERFQSRGEMAQEWRLVDYFVAANLFAASPNV
jgi:hypothetical protein